MAKEKDPPASDPANDPAAGDKTGSGQGGSPSTGEIRCPACESRLGEQGREMRKKSERLEMLEKRAAELEALKGELSTSRARIQDLEKKVGELEGAPDEPDEPEPDSEEFILWEDRD